MSTAIEASSTRAVADATAGERIEAVRKVLADFKAEVETKLDGILQAAQAVVAGTENPQAVYDATGELLNEAPFMADDLHHAVGMIFMPHRFADSIGTFDRIREEIGLPVSWRRFWAA